MKTSGSNVPSNAYPGSTERNIRLFVKGFCLTFICIGPTHFHTASSVGNPGFGNNATIYVLCVSTLGKLVGTQYYTTTGNYIDFTNGKIKHGCIISFFVQFSFNFKHDKTGC